MVSVKCLYCDADNDPIANAGYCDSCGKKLPPAAAFRSRHTGEAGSTDGPDPIAGPGRRTSEALLGVAVVQLVAGGLFLILGPLLLTKSPDNFFPKVLFRTVPPVIAFAVLSWLAQRRPLLAAGLALAIHLGWTAYGFVSEPTLSISWLAVSLPVLAMLGWPIWTSQPRAQQG
jgi:hypothetical protein